MACDNQGVSTEPSSSSFSRSRGASDPSPWHDQADHLPDGTPNDLPGDLPNDLPSDVASLTYEQAREELVAVVGRLEAGSVPLEDSLALWERGEALAQRCQAWLDQARARLAAVDNRGRSAQGDASEPPQ